MHLTMSIKRVTTTFLVKGFRDASTARHDLRIAIFHRCSTMPTFPNRYAGCSGSMEEGEVPWETARRELQEETNWTPASEQQWEEPAAAGLHVDVDFVSPRSGRSSIIRVYPFVVIVADSFEVELRGTEHDTWQWMGLDELESLDNQEKTVPSLSLAFHHATAGQFDTRVTQEERKWASDKENGASTMSQNALRLIMKSGTSDPARLAVLRPTMVAIVNGMNAVQKILSKQQSTRTQAAQQVLAALASETERSVEHAVDALHSLHQDNNPQRPLVLATFSRSSTLLSIVQRVLIDYSEIVQLPILCAKSTPGDEGELMAKDVNDVDSFKRSGDTTTARCVEDGELKDLIRNNQVDILLVGADCVLSDHSAVGNKIGTAELASIAHKSSSRCQVLCCTDRFKVWDDIFPPPLEQDLFEMVPIQDHIDQLLLPPTP